MNSQPDTLDLTFFREHGYQILKGVIAPETIASLSTFLHGAVDDAFNRIRKAIAFDSVPDLVAQIGKLRDEGKLDALDRDVQTAITGHFTLETRLSPELWAVPRLPAVRGILDGVFGGVPLYMHMPPTARFSLPGNTNAAVPPHRDVSYNAHMRDFVILWVPLTDIDDRCGGVAIYEGSHRDSEQPVGTDGLWLKGVSTDGYERRHCTMNVGDALLMCDTLLHASVPNTSDRTRCSIDFRVFGAPNRSTKHALDLQSWKVLDPNPA